MSGFAFVDNPASIDHPVLSFFLDYWRRKRGGNALPLRQSFNPREVGPNLPWVISADALPGLVEFRYRVVGTRVCRYFLGDGTGKTVREAYAHVEPTIVKGILRLYRFTCRQGTPVRASAPAYHYQGVYFPEYDLLSMPYSSDGQTADRVVIAFTFPAEELNRRKSKSPASSHPNASDMQLD